MAGIIIGIVFGIIGLAGAYFSFQSLPFNKREQLIIKVNNRIKYTKNLFYSMIPNFLLNPVLYFDDLNLMEKRFIFSITNNSNGKADINKISYIFLETNRKLESRKNEMFRGLKNRGVIKIIKEDGRTFIKVSNKILKQYGQQN